MRRTIGMAVVAALGVACQDRPPSPSASGGPPPTALRFNDGTEGSGVRFRHEPSRSPDKAMPEIMGSGVAVVDVNRDGAPDLILVNGGRLGAAARPASARTRLYLNDGHGRFTDATDAWQLTSAGYGQGVAVGDIDNDGWCDVFLTSADGDNRLLRNTGHSFEDVTASAGFRPDGEWASSAGFFDYDLDGDLDLYVVKYVALPTATPVKTFAMGRLKYPTPIVFDALADELWQNDGRGRFMDVSAAVGISARRANGLALAIADLDRNGRPDVYVANDLDGNLLWRNDGGRFTDVGGLAGVAYGAGGQEEAGMGADVSDVDGDGALDLVVTNFQDEPASLYRQVAPWQFQEVSATAGLAQTSRLRLKFGVDFFDADNDGDEDLVVANGHIDDTIDDASASVSFAQPNSLYENAGAGQLRDVTAGAGTALADRQVSRGLATGDLDGDGGLDIVVVNNGGTAQLLLNASPLRGHYLGVWLEGRRANRSAIGARVVARIGDRTVEREVMGAQSYLSISDFRLHLGLGAATIVDDLTVYWPGGESQRLGPLSGDRFYRVRQGDPAMAFVPGSAVVSPAAR